MWESYVQALADARHTLIPLPRGAHMGSCCRQLHQVLRILRALSLHTQ